MNEKIIFEHKDDRTLCCYFSSEHSSLICSIFVEQKGESDSPIEVLWNVNDRFDLKEMVKNAITYAIIEENCTVKYTIAFHIVKDDVDIFSCAINSFTCCAIFMGISLKDTVISHSDDLCNVIYMLHKQKVLAFYIEGGLKKNECFEKIIKCVEECKLKGNKLKNRIIKYIETKL